MSRVEWGAGLKPFDAGLDRGVLYLPEAVPWNGLVSVDEVDVSGDVAYYFDGRQVGVVKETFDYQATVQAFTYPEVFEEYNGYSERPSATRFGLSYRSHHGDTYQIHLVYNALVVPKGLKRETRDTVLNPLLFTWDISTVNTPVPGARPTAHLVIDSGSLPGVVLALEDILYGTDTTPARLPSAAELVALYEAAMRLKVAYNDDGTYTLDGPDELVSIASDGSFQINAPTAFVQRFGEFIVSSYGK